MLLELSELKIVPFILLFILVAGFMIGCFKSTPSKPIEEGDYYAVAQEEDTGYTIVKVLKVDDLGCHIRLYSNVYQQIPKSIDPASLKIIGINDKENEQQVLGMGHLPLSKKSFASWGPIFIQNGTVDESELEGYQMWKEAEGGYF